VTVANANALSRLHLELTDQTKLQHYLIASLSVSGAALEHWSSGFGRACAWYAHLLGQGYDRVPFFVVHDVGHLLLEGRRFQFRLLSGSDAATEATSHDSVAARARRRQVAYENHLLNRLLGLPAFERCVEALEDVARNDAIVGMLLERLLQPLRTAPLPRVEAPPHMVRGVSLGRHVTPETAAHDLAEALHLDDVEPGLDGPAMLDTMALTCAERFQTLQLRGLIGEEDAFIVRNFDVLGTRTQRLLARQIAETEHALGEAPPPPPHLRSETPQVAVDLEDAGYFPQGGLDQLATRGSIENLVRSELVYLDPEQRPDIFTMRFVEGELLYYTRDEGQLMRRSRALHVVLDIGHEHDVLFPGHPARVSVLLRAVVQRLVEDVSVLHESDALHLTLHATGPLAEEIAAQWGVRFSERIERGELDVVAAASAPDLSEIPSPLVEQGRISSLIYIGGASPPEADRQLHHQRAGLAITWLRVVDEASDGARHATASDLASDWQMELGLADEDVMDTLRTLRTALTWRAFS